MPSNPSPYRCPACGFGVFNRRYPKCERCAAPLPASLLYSAEEIARLDAEARAAETERAKRDAPAEATRDARMDEDAVLISMMSGAIVPAVVASIDVGGGGSDGSG